MRLSSLVSAAVFFVFSAAEARAQQPAPSYARQVRPVLARYCLECHSSDKAKGGLNLETFKSLMKGGDSGPALVPGNPAQSRLVLLVEGKDKPRMPPAKARQPKPEEVAILSAWIASGAKDDSTEIKVTIPDVKPKVPSSPPVAAVAYHPDGKRLAAGSYQTALLIDVATGDVTAKLSGQIESVTALAFDREGKFLAVGSGSASLTGEVRIYSVPPGEKPVHVLAGHKDIIHDVAFSPSGKQLASTGYDRLIKLWDVGSGKELQTLRDHSDTVNGIAFSPDGKLLVSASADRAVKVWDVETGRRLHTLADSTDWLYTVVYHPDGKQIAAAGVDKSIRVWEVSVENTRLVHAVFAHEGAVNRLAYSADGKTLYSLGEDRAIKSWDTETMRERKVYPRQPDVPLALGVRPDRKQLAVGRHDGALVLLDEATGELQSQPLPAKPKPPQFNKITPPAGQRGTTVRVKIEGADLDAVTKITVNHPNTTAAIVAEGRTAALLQADLKFPADTPAASYQVTLKGPAGASAPQSFLVDLFNPVSDQEPNDSPGTAQTITLPVSLAGSLDRAGDIDHFRIDAKAGEQIGAQALPGATSKLEPALHLADESGKVLVNSLTGSLGYTCAKAGRYTLSIHDRDYRGGAEMAYRLHVGTVPVVTSIFPLGLPQGTEADIQLEGVHLGTVKSVKVKVPADAAAGSFVPVAVQTPHGAPLGNPRVLVGEFPEVARGSENAIAVPGTGNGRIDKPGQTETWRFTAKKGQRLILEINSRRLGTPMDSYIEILDGKGQPLPRATLRCLARTYTTFRDHDSADPAIRLEAWNELTVNDFMYVGNELLKIQALPKNPDDNCVFFSVSGQRIGQLDTTPSHHSIGEPMYKVSIHPPGTTFPPNGLPVVTLFYRNDDGGPPHGKDSRIYFDPPADGDYQVRVGDTRAQGGNNYAYRLTIRPPKHDYSVSFNPTAPSVWKGGAVPVAVSTTRTDGFEGPIAIRLENLPPGFSAPATTIPEGENSTAFALWADPSAVAPTTGNPLKIVAKATIDGKEVTREAVGQLPKVIDPGDLVTTTEQSEVTIRPGGEVRLTVKIERRNGFAGRVPIEVRGLPHGVRVLDIGLNGILIIPTETTRTIAIYAEPWAKPQEHPFVVLSKREGKNTEHAARSVMLKVAK